MQNMGVSKIQKRGEVESKLQGIIEKLCNTAVVMRKISRGEDQWEKKDVNDFSKMSA